jgi:hypothetical protein
MKLLFFPLLFLSLQSCAVFDIPGRIAGYSVEKFENEKTGKYSQIFEMSKEDCFKASLETLKALKARVTHKNYKKGFIIAFDFSKSFDYCLDSTEAGIFISEAENGTLNVSVVCNNSMLAKILSDKFFSILNSKKAEGSDLENKKD